MNVTAIHPYGVFIEASIEVFHCNMTISTRAIVGPFELKGDAEAWAKKYESACCVLNGPMPQEHMEAHCVRENLGAYVQGFCSSVEVKAIDRAWRSSDLLLPAEDPVVAAGFLPMHFLEFTRKAIEEVQQKLSTPPEEGEM